MSKMLMENVKKGDLNEVKTLVENGADICSKSECALQLSACYGHLDIIKYFIEKGIKYCADCYNNALEHSVFNGHFDMVKYLMNCKYIIPYILERVLIVGIEQNRIDIVKYIIALKYDDLHACQLDRLLIIASKVNRDDIAKYLVRAADADIDSYDGTASPWSALTLAPFFIKNFTISKYPFLALFDNAPANSRAPFSTRNLTISKFPF